MPSHNKQGVSIDPQSDDSPVHATSIQPASDDSELVHRLVQRHTDAMDDLIDRHATRLRQTIGRLLAWSSDVDDVLQEVLVLAWRRIDTFRGTGSLEDWLVSMAFHRCRDHQRSLRRRWAHWLHYADRSSAPSNPSPSTHHLNLPTETAAWQQLQHAMQQLSASDRELLVMLYLEAWSHQQLADHLGISIATLQVRLHRARSRLKHHIESP
jgi:RNA polymerase sigma-70 factor, ECF subfamily